MAVTYNLKGTTNPSFKIGKNGVTLTSIDGETLQVESTSTGSASGPNLDLYRNSSSPADSDYLGEIKFQGENDAGAKTNYAKITGKILDVTDGTEDGILEFAFQKAGSNNISARFRSDSLQLINGTNLYIGGTGSIQFEGANADAHETSLQVTEPTADRTITLPDETGTVVTKDSNTGAIQLPVGTTAERPASPSVGMVRYNTTTSHFEGYDGSAWVHLETQYG
ncbi:MAG: hypothetical protein CBD16_02715 [Betaproteobacteria bacterium TMED156]|nr:MAG: hypothetical protein CBD16_02715 [Betaproteobacteria bacterium TMED156]